MKKVEWISIRGNVGGHDWLISNCPYHVSNLSKEIWVKTRIAISFGESVLDRKEMFLTVGAEVQGYRVSWLRLGDFLAGCTAALNLFVSNRWLMFSDSVREFVECLYRHAAAGLWEDFSETLAKQPVLGASPSRQWSKKDLTSVGNIYENPGAFVDGPSPRPPDSAIFFEDSGMYVIGSESYDSLYIPELWRHLNQTMWGHEEMTGASRIYGFNVELMPALGSVFAIYEGESWGDILAKMKKELMDGIEGEGGEPATSFEDACLSFEISSAKKDVIFIYEHGTVVNI